MAILVQTGYVRRTSKLPLLKQPQPLIDHLTSLTRKQTAILRVPGFFERLSTCLQQVHAPIVATYTSSVNHINAVASQDLLIHLVGARWTGATRQQQLTEMLSAADAQMNQLVQQQANQALNASIVATALAGIGALGLPLFGWLSLPLQLYVSLDPIKRLSMKLRQGAIPTDLLVVLSVFGNLLSGHFFAGACVILIFRVGNKLELAVKEHSQQNLLDTFRQHAANVWVVVDGVEVERSFDSLQKDDLIVVHSGETVPVDGVIVAGAALVDQHILTGEARPVEKMVGDPLVAATFMLAGKVTLRVEKTGQATTAGQIGTILQKTVNFKSEMQLHGQTFANRTVIPTLLLSIWAGLQLGLESGIGIVNAHFKNRINMVVPVSLLHFLNRATHAQILIKDGRSLDLLHQIDTLVFDKTGTLTKDQPHVATVHLYTSCTENEVLAYAAAAEYKQTHPIARAILATATARQLDLPYLDHAAYKVGYGLTVQIQGQQAASILCRAKGLPCRPAYHLPNSRCMKKDIYWCWSPYRQS